MEPRPTHYRALVRPDETQQEAAQEAPPPAAATSSRRSFLTSALLVGLGAAAHNVVSPLFSGSPAIAKPVSSTEDVMGLLADTTGTDESIANGKYVVKVCFDPDLSAMDALEFNLNYFLSSHGNAGKPHLMVGESSVIDPYTGDRLIDMLNQIVRDDFQIDKLLFMRSDGYLSDANLALLFGAIYTVDENNQNADSYPQPDISVVAPNVFPQPGGRNANKAVLYINNFDHIRQVVQDLKEKKRGAGEELMPYMRDALLRLMGIDYGKEFPKEAMASVQWLVESMAVTMPPETVAPSFREKEEVKGIIAKSGGGRTI